MPEREIRKKKPYEDGGGDADAECGSPAHIRRNRFPGGRPSRVDAAHGTRANRPRFQKRNNAFSENGLSNEAQISRRFASEAVEKTGII